MESSKMKNMVILRNLPSNLVEEAIVILKSSKKVRKLEKIENSKKINQEEQVRKEKKTRRTACLFWRSGRDSNPRYPYEVHTISNRARYGRFDTTPSASHKGYYISFFPVVKPKF